MSMYYGILNAPNAYRTKALGRGVLPYMGYIGMCGPKGYGFSAVLVINRVSILAILVINRGWFLYSSLDMGMFSF